MIISSSKQAQLRLAQKSSVYNSAIFRTKLAPLTLIGLSYDYFKLLFQSFEESLIQITLEKYYLQK